MAILAGIDEAGYGPLLGPLVVTSIAFQLPDELLKSDLWHKLKKSISKQKKHIAGRLLITDSKKAYSRAAGPRHLERTVLACLKCLGQQPDTFSGLLEILCPQTKSRLQNYPWYQNSDALQRHCDDADIKIASEVFADNMSSYKMKLLSIHSCCLDVAHYNHLVDNMRNKASVLFSTTCALIKSVWDGTADPNIQIIIDRQGGRTHYSRHLLRMFGGLKLTIINESDNLSSYELSGSRKKMRLHFVTKADQKYLPASLASMVSKYIRELLVERINRYFLSHQPQLKPTAGYWKDGLRFIEELRTKAPHVKYQTTQLIRSR